uniref:Calponin-homology (CH) domain-containing protein n=1 Tax=Latimeria chalumnae TaxID=7897 RepID=H3A1G7_LATCH
RNPPLVVNDLFEDIKDGIKLIALLEVLSGQKLPCEQSRHLKRIHWVANIGTALKFLEGRRIKLVNINSTDIADGRPSIVLGLIWTIILYFQIEELTSNLPLLQSLSSSTSSVDSLVSSETASPPTKRKVMTRFHGNAKKALLKWVQYTAAKRMGIEVKDFGLSWRSGVAFHSVIHAIRPELVDMEKLKGRSNRENLEEAFAIAETQLGIPRLLDPEDVDVDKPDEKSIMTYVAQFLKHYPDPNNTEADGQEEDKEDRLMLRELKAWLEQFERDLTRAQIAEGSLQEKYQLFKNFRVQYEMKKKQIEVVVQPLQKDGKLSMDQIMVKQAWERVSSRLLEWHNRLDKSLPAPLGTIGAWLHRAEAALREEIAVQQAHEETANVIHRKLEQHKEVLKQLDGHKQTFQQIHRAGSVNGVPVPMEQLVDMAERFTYVSSNSQHHLIKLGFLEMKYRLLAFLVVAESKLKSWIIKYGRRESVELLLQNYIAFVEGSKFFEQYEVTYQTLKQAAEMYMKADGSAEEGESVTKFLNDTAVQWRNLSVEVRSVRSMLEEVITNWDKYSSTVASLQAWLEDAEKILNQPEQARKEFFRNLPQWIQQHTTMNDAGNFLIETCDETVSRDLKQQLLLLNGRWRELFMKVKHYARANEVDRMKKEYLDGFAALKTFVETANEKLTSPLEVSFLNVKTFVQNVEDIKQKAPALEAQYKSITRTAQLLTKDTPQEEANQMLAAMTGIKDQLSKIKESFPPLLRESQQLLPPIEELEKQITTFHESLEKANQIIIGGELESQAAVHFKQKHQDLTVCQENCKKASSLIEKNNQTVQKLLLSSKTLQHFNRSLLQKKVTEIQVTFQSMLKQAIEWRKQVEANSSLMKRFEETRIELEKVLWIAEAFLKEKGNPEELLKKHTEFFGQLDQRVLNAFLKACDELTDILPEQEQQSLQETVRKLHKQWKDLQGEAPYHLLHLKIEVEKNKLVGTVEECRSELARENKQLPTAGSEQLIKDHRNYFSEKGPYQLCEKRLKLVEELCQKLPEKDPIGATAEGSKRTLDDLKSHIDSTYQKLLEHPDKWKEYKTRFSDQSSWLTTVRRQLRQIKNDVKDPSKYRQVKSATEKVRQEANKQEGNLGWLKSRLTALNEVSSENEIKKQESELLKLSDDFRYVQVLLAEIEKLLSAVGECTQYREDVESSLQELNIFQKEAEAEVDKILDSDSLQEAQELFLQHQQQKLKRLKAKRQDMQKQVDHGKQLQAEEGLGGSFQEDIRKLESTLNNMEQTEERQEEQLKAMLMEWEQFEMKTGDVLDFLNRANPTLERRLNFSSLESLSFELEQTKELYQDNQAIAAQAQALVKKSAEIQLGWKRKQALQQQAKSIEEQVTKVEKNLGKDIKQMEMVKSKWEQFVSNCEALTVWINDKEKELDTTESSSSPLDSQISKIKAILKEINSKAKEILLLEEDSQALTVFVTSGEAALIMARLTQIGRHLEELGKRAQQLEDTAMENASQHQKHEESLQQAEQKLIEIEGKLAAPVSSCSSVTETNKVLQEHMDLCWEVEQMKSTMLSLLSSAQKLHNKDKAIQEASVLHQRYEKMLQQTKEKQNQLENLLLQWQKYEKDLANFIAWLERCEELADPKRQYISADSTKLQSEVQSLQDLQSEVTSHEPLYQSLVQENKSLSPSASKDSIKLMNQNLEQLEKRWKALPQILSKRILFLQSVIAQHQQFDEQLLKFSCWIEQFLNGLQATSEISTADLPTAFHQIKDHLTAIENQIVEKKNLMDQADKLCSSEPEGHTFLQGKADDCFQLFQEANQIVERRKDVLNQLDVFLETHKVAENVLSRMKQTVESATNWDKVKIETLEKELEDIIPDINRLQSLSVTLDGALSKAQYHLKSGSSEQRTSCRTLAESLGMDLDQVQNHLGTKQSEAEALGALWNSFKDRKEQLLKNIEDIEEKADKEGLKEPTLQALQHRLRTFNQLEDELNSHQHELQWLMDKAKQLAQKDMSLATEADKEINALEVSWEDVKKLINENQEQCCILVDLMREYQSLKSSITKVIGNADNVTVIKSTLKDQEDIRRTLSRHEAMKNEINSSQEDLDNFTNKGKHLVAELKKIHDCDPMLVKKDMDIVVDQWLDVSERTDDNIERLSVSLALWEDVLNISDDIDMWSSNSISELSENINNLSNSQKIEAWLVEFQLEVKNKEQKLEDFHSKVSELKDLTKSQEPPTELQVMEADVRKKLEHVEEMSVVAQETLKDFNTQKKQLENFINQMAGWLNNVAESLSTCGHGQDPEDLKKVK